jgi:hypothetical protein
MLFNKILWAPFKNERRQNLRNALEIELRETHIRGRLRSRWGQRKRESG